MSTISTQTLSRVSAYVVGKFGTERIMFGSHRPISGLSRSFASVYAGYEELTAGLTESEQDSVFRHNAVEWFRLPKVAD